jgi:hypothetical protein
MCFYCSTRYCFIFHSLFMHFYPFFF